MDRPKRRKAVEQRPDSSEHHSSDPEDSWSGAESVGKLMSKKVVIVKRQVKPSSNPDVLKGLLSKYPLVVDSGSTRHLLMKKFECCITDSKSVNIVVNGLNGGDNCASEGTLTVSHCPLKPLVLDKTLILRKVNITSSPSMH